MSTPSCLVAAALLGFLVCCAPASYLRNGSHGRIPLDPKGDTAAVQLGDLRTIRSELLAATDSTLMLALPRGVTEIDRRDIRSIEIENYENRNWVPPMLLLEVLPAIVLGFTAESVEGNEGSIVTVPLVLSIPTLLNWAVFEYGGKPPPRPRSGEKLVIKPEQVELGMELRVRRNKGRNRKGVVVEVNEDNFVLSRSGSRFKRRIAFSDVARIEQVGYETEELNRYARFPLGLSAEQMSKLLENYRQKEIKYIF